MILKEGLENLQSTVDYAYPNARVMATRGLMFRNEDFKALASAKSLEEYIGLLDHSPYKKYLAKITEIDIDVVSRALFSSLIDLSKFILGVAPKQTKDFFCVAAMRHEIELINLVLNRFERETAAPEDVESPLHTPYISVLGPDLRRVVKSLETAKSREEALGILKATRYRFLSGLSASERESPSCIACTLDRHYYEELWRSLGGLSKKDVGYAKRIIGTEIDVANIMVLFLSSKYSYASERYLVPSGYRLRDLGVFKGQSIEVIASLLSKTYYRRAVEDGYDSYESDKSLLKLEMNLDSLVITESKKMFVDLSGHIGILLGFMKLKEFEIKNLSAIAVGIENNLNPKEIMDVVIS